MTEIAYHWKESAASFVITRQDVRGSSEFKVTLAMVGAMAATHAEIEASLTPWRLDRRKRKRIRRKASRAARKAWLEDRTLPSAPLSQPHKTGD